jgi:transcriptional regulator with XRE-family HTH domain
MPRRKCDAFDRVIGHNIRKYRLDRRWSQATLAENLGITFQQIQKYEAGINRVPACTLFLIARALSVEFELFFREQ